MRTGLHKFGAFNIGGGLALIGIVSQTSLQQYKVSMPPNPQDFLHINPQFAELDLAGIGGIGIIEPVSKAKKLVQQFCGP